MTDRICHESSSAAWNNGVKNVLKSHKKYRKINVLEIILWKIESLGNVSLNCSKVEMVMITSKRDPPHCVWYTRPISEINICNVHLVCRSNPLNSAPLWWLTVCGVSSLQEKKIGAFLWSTILKTLKSSYLKKRRINFENIYYILGIKSNKYNLIFICTSKWSIMN